MRVSPRDLEIGIRILVQIVLLTASATFSGSEVALFSLSRIDLCLCLCLTPPTRIPIPSLLDDRIGEKSMSDYINPLLFLSPHPTIDQTLPLLQARKDHLGIVVDEFGSAIGIITLEDAFEEVVGDINVGYDVDEYKTPRQFFD